MQLIEFEFEINYTVHYIILYNENKTKAITQFSNIIIK